MNEMDHYPQIAEKFIEELTEFSGYKFDVAVAMNNYLDILVKEIRKNESHKNDFNEIKYFPKLKVDILLSIKNRKNNSKAIPILLEVKYAEQLKLIDHSQLIGYLHTSRFLNMGVLLLVSKPTNKADISNDLQELIAMKAIRFEHTEGSLGSESSVRRIQTGLMTYNIGGRLKNPIEANDHIGDLEYLRKCIIKEMA